MSTPQQIRAYLIDPKEKTITQVEYNGDYQQIYQLIGGDCFGSAYFNDAGDHIYYRDDPGVLRESKDIFDIPGYPKQLRGKALVMGQQGGKEAPSTVDIAWLRSNIVFYAVGRSDRQSDQHRKERLALLGWAVFGWAVFGSLLCLWFWHANIHCPKDVSMLIRDLHGDHTKQGKAARCLAESEDAAAISALTGCVMDPSSCSGAHYDVLFRLTSSSSPDYPASKVLHDSLNRAIESHDTNFLCRSYEYWLERRHRRAVPLMIDALETCGDQRMAQMLLNCENVDLERAAYAWAPRHSFQITRKWVPPKPPSEMGGKPW